MANTTRISFNKIAVNLSGIGTYLRGTLQAISEGANISVINPFADNFEAVSYEIDFFRDSNGDSLGQTQQEVIDVLNDIFSFKDTDGLIDTLKRSDQDGQSIVTNLTLYTDVLNREVPLIKGTYRALVEYKWSANSTSSDFLSKLFIDGQEPYSPVLPELHRQEPQDSGGSLTGIIGSDQIMPFSENFNFSVESDKNVRFILQLASSRAGTSCAMYFPKIMIYRTTV